MWAPEGWAVRHVGVPIDSLGVSLHQHGPQARLGACCGARHHATGGAAAQSTVNTRTRAGSAREILLSVTAADRSEPDQYPIYIPILRGQLTNLQYQYLEGPKTIFSSILSCKILGAMPSQRSGCSSRTTCGSMK